MDNFFIINNLYCIIKILKKHTIESSKLNNLVNMIKFNKIYFEKVKKESCHNVNRNVAKTLKIEMSLKRQSQLP